ncbi:hypothetical protein [aff. Roholtiella sp. LEGE 12411]|uniref:hypothetical protein n=1 Tax=aff. Roholtiella sp. LEGE 12411 TaxID=1828822 RepID=UPI00187E9C14|nr:hypothetical protein [aff. Roholtiella sp. LEGE 12411]
MTLARILLSVTIFLILLKSKRDWALGIGHGALGIGIQMKNYGICSNPEYILEFFLSPLFHFAYIAC